MSAEVASELAVLWAIEPERLQRVRKNDGRLEVFDVLQLITGCARNNARVMWQRLIEVRPELAAGCSQLKFNSRGRGCHQETPAIDAKGVVQLLMALPGPAAVQFRLQAADVLVCYLGGDETLAAEVRVNGQAQQALAALQPEHPARLFGEAVERESAAGALASTPQAEALEEEAACLQRRLLEVQIEALQAQARREDAEAKHLHLQSVAQAFQLCEQQGFTRNHRYEGLAREAVNAAMLPPGQSPDGSLDAAQYLQMRGHTPAQIARMAGEFGKGPEARASDAAGRSSPHYYAGLGAGGTRDFPIPQAGGPRVFGCGVHRVHAEAPVPTRGASDACAAAASAPGAGRHQGHARQALQGPPRSVRLRGCRLRLAPPLPCSSCKADPAACALAVVR